MRAQLTDFFLGLGVALELIGCLGVLVMRSPHDRLHYTSPGILGAICIAGAVVINESFSLIGDKAILIAAFVCVASPILTHAIGRAARTDEGGDWRARPAEGIEIEDA